MALRFGTDGVRGVALSELTTDYVESLGLAAARVLGGGRWLIGRDTRESGPILEFALSEGLRAGGATVVLAGVVPTPALAWMAAAEGVPAAMITASHNPYTDNGVKIFAAGGLKLSDEVERRIEAAIGVAEPVTDAPQPIGTARCRYTDHVVSLLPPGALGGLRVVLDCANGAMSGFAPQAARALGATVSLINTEPDGRNINVDSGATAPQNLAEAVVAYGADLGLAFDGDGDRVIAVDELGGIVDGDRILALAATRMRDAGELAADTVVVTVMSNLGFRLAMQAAGITVVETAVGDRYVLEALDAGGYSLGGEQSGHVIFRNLSTTGDGLLAGLRLAHHVRTSGRPLSELAAEAMVGFPQVLLNVPVAERHPEVGAELRDEVAAAEAALAGTGRILLRGSGTEPVVRVMVEAETEALAREVAESLAAVVRTRYSA